MTTAIGSTYATGIRRESAQTHSLALLKIVEALRPLSDADEIMFTACQILGEHLGANRVFYTTIIDESIAVITRDYVNGVRSIAGRIPLDAFADVLKTTFKRGEDMTVEDVAADPRFAESARVAYATLQVTSVMGTGLVKSGRWVGALGVHSVTPRVWTPDDVALLRDTAQQTWAALERAEAVAARRETDERYAALFEQSPIATAITRLADHVIVDVNPAFLRLFEFERREVVGRTSVDVGIALDSERLSVEREFAAAGMVREFECTRTTKSGEKRIVLLDVVPITTGGEQYVLTKVRDVTEQRRAEERARLYEQSRERLLDLDAMERLHAVSMRFFDEERLQDVLDEILEASIAITQADFGDIQVLDSRSSSLEIVAARGLPAWWLEYWSRVSKGQGSCGLALERGERVIVEHVADSPAFDGEALKIQLRAGIRAVQSTPLVDRSGTLLGVISTLYTTPQRPSDRALRLLDLLARQAADILDRARREAEERRHETEQRILAGVGGVLSTLDYEHALSNVVQLTVESLADFAVIFLVEEDGKVRRTAVASHAPEHVSILEPTLALPSQPRPTHPIWDVISSQRPLIRAIDPTEYEIMAEGPEHLRAIRSTNPRSVLLSPMLAGDSCVGVIGLVSSSRQFDDRHSRLVEEIGRRCALFVENMRLHEREQRAIRARSDVLGIVAHDLRNPLNSIAVNARILQAQSADAESVESIRRASTRMTRIIQDLLDVARFEAGMLEVERAPVFAADLISDVVRAHRKPVDARALELRVVAAANLPLVTADRERVAQVFENLVSNAMKFTTAGAITIEARSSGDEVVFSVADTGIGISAEYLPRLFEPFWQAPHGKRDGAGLGLSIVKTIVDVHGGRTWATSELGVGSTFHFTLPIASVAAVVSTPGSATATAEPVVLVVDDDADLRRALARLLRQHGYVVATAANGQEGLDYLRTGARPTVIVLDLAMPVLDGWGFLEARNRSPDFRWIPVVVISGQGQAVATRVSSMNAALLQKPVAPEDLVAAMQRAVRA
jgi:PAS domain S-box-containing protein